MTMRKATRPAKEAPSKGALLAQKYRAIANNLTDGERRRHRAHAMRVIYGKSGSRGLLA